MAQGNVFALGITSPPDKVPDAPHVQRRVQELPFGALTWETFERLCHRLTALAATYAVNAALMYLGGV